MSHLQQRGLEEGLFHGNLQLDFFLTFLPCVVKRKEMSLRIILF